MVLTIGQRRRHAPRPRRRNRRSGRSLLELTGCLIAIVGGAWLGAIYLGIDVRRAVHTAMEQSDVLDKVPPGWRPANPDNGFTREQMVAALREELGTLRQDIAELREGGKPPAVREPDARPSGSPTPQVSPSKTLAYWARINEIVAGQAGLQQDADSAFSTAGAAHVFTLKERVSRFAAKAVEAIPTDEVDPVVLQFGGQLQRWYEQGGTLYERAAGIWQSPVAGGRTQLNERWNRAELHHRNEAKLLGDKAAALRGILTERFGVEFPPFSAPAPGDRDAGETPDG
jgi:hypothetical protein